MICRYGKLSFLMIEEKNLEKEKVCEYLVTRVSDCFLSEGHYLTYEKQEKLIEKFFKPPTQIPIRLKIEPQGVESFLEYQMPFLDEPKECENGALEVSLSLDPQNPYVQLFFLEGCEVYTILEPSSFKENIQSKLQMALERYRQQESL